MSNPSGCDVNKKGNLLKVRAMCPNLKCKCQKKTVFTPNQSPFGAGCFRIQ